MHPRESSAPRPTLWRVCALLLLCAVTYGWGMTSHGLTNWQEAQRALVAREMFEASEWIVPTSQGVPYMAKPPVIYWVQMLIAHARRALGAEPFIDETEIRLAVALAGVSGVLVTYWAAQVMLAPGRARERRDPPGPRHDPQDAGTAHDAAFLAALGLATGVLYVRSSRIGELDVMIVPFVTGAIGLLALAWRQARQGETHWPALLGAAAASTGAVLTKGPPALLVIALAGLASVLMLERGGVWARGDGTHTATRQRSPIDALAAVAGGLGLLVAAWLNASRVPSLWHGLGLCFFALVGAGLGLGTVRVARARRQWWPVLWRLHPWLVMGAPLLAMALWGWSAQQQIGDLVLERAKVELEDNLRVLVLDSPTKNLGFMVYGLAPISLAFVAGVLWLVKDRPILSRTQRIPAVWCGLGYVAFSTLGKGVARYLTPLWPGVAMLGGLFLAHALARTSGPRRRAAMIAIVSLCALSGVVQGWWYGVGRELNVPERSPRGLVREILRSQPDATICSWKLVEPALDYYARRTVERLREPADFDSALARHGSFLLFAPMTKASGLPVNLEDTLRRLNARASRVKTTATLRLEAGRSEVGVFRIEPAR